MDIVDSPHTQAEVVLRLVVVVHNSNSSVVLAIVRRWLFLMPHRLPPV